MENLEKIPAWQLTKVRNKKEVIDEVESLNCSPTYLGGGHKRLSLPLSPSQTLQTAPAPTTPHLPDD